MEKWKINIWRYNSQILTILIISTVLWTYVDVFAIRKENDNSDESFILQLNI
jgi:hypothetical protein